MCCLFTSCVGYAFNKFSSFKNKTKMHVANCICNNDFQQILREETCLLLSYVEAAFLYTIMHVCVFPHKLFSTIHNVDDAICTINWSDYTNYRQLNLVHSCLIWLVQANLYFVVGHRSPFICCIPTYIIILYAHTSSHT